MIDPKYMIRAVELAEKAIGNVSPNPMVGAVVVSENGETLGEGYHQICGEAHAEVNAIAMAERNGVDAVKFSQSTLYVTLEPCSHYGKTPPCADLIIEKGIKNVVVGCVDPFEKVSGRGIEKLRAAGVNVEVGVCQSECRELNRRFITAQTLGRPYVILKWAQSSDGFLDILRSSNVPPAWFTGEKARKLVHTWRAQEDAIMVGRKTAQMDNPSLTVRSVEGRNPLRVVLDAKGVLGDELHLFDNEVKTIVFSESKNAHIEKENVEVEVLENWQNVVDQVLGSLHRRGVQSLIVEGGTMLLNSFIDSGLWDEARIFTAAHPIEYYYPQIVDIKGVVAPNLLQRAEQSKTAIYRGPKEQVEGARLEFFSCRQW